MTKPVDPHQRSRKLAVSFWSDLKPRWVSGASVPATTARKTNRQAAETQVRVLRAKGYAAYSHPIGHSPEGPPSSWMFDENGRLQLED